MLRSKRKRNSEASPLVLADRARDAGDWALAARHYREALARNPAQPAIWVQYGHALKESGNVAEAEKAYRQSLELDGRLAEAHLQLGHVLKMQGRKEEAAKCYFQALMLAGAPPAAFELIALCWEPIGKLEAGWNQHIPTFLSALASVNAFAHEQARLAREIEELRKELDALKNDPTMTADEPGTIEPRAERARDGRTPEVPVPLDRRAGSAL
jgi:Flp pilus assembly protein TadD